MADVCAGPGMKLVTRLRLQDPSLTAPSIIAEISHLVAGYAQIEQLVCGPFMVEEVRDVCRQQLERYGR